MTIQEKLIEPEDLAKVSPTMFSMLCQAQHRTQREYLVEKILAGALIDHNGNVVLSKEKIEALKTEANLSFLDLPVKAQKGLSKTVARFFAMVVYYLASQQLANVRLTKLLGEIEQKSEDEAIKELIKKTRREWEDNRG